MRALTRAGRATTTVAMAFLLFAGVSTSAHAATGSFTYVSQDGDNFEIDDPPNGRCLPLFDGAAFIDNETDTPAFLYRTPGCHDLFDSMEPHTTKSYPTNGGPFFVEFL
ncbi:hypothetical protein ACIQF6_20590 [Kitasatospora sp. NPDC092948]|uniref:hypothetical protein n=1 Tax=Kitasatospora sp. NPDC092948 TaxID=3364088 RepID=UPI00380C6B00